MTTCGDDSCWWAPYPRLSASIRRRDAFARVRVLRGIGTKARTPRDDQFDQRARAGDAPGTVLYERLSMGVDREPTLRTVEVRHGCSLWLALCDDSGGAPRSPTLHLTLTAQATYAKSLASNGISAFAQSKTRPGLRMIRDRALRTVGTTRLGLPLPRLARISLVVFRALEREISYARFALTSTALTKARTFRWTICSTAAMNSAWVAAWKEVRVSRTRSKDGTEMRCDPGVEPIRSREAAGEDGWPPPTSPGGLHGSNVVADAH